MASFMSAVPNFQPWFIFPQEYQSYGLPTNVSQPDIDNLVQFCSGIIDVHCGRTDGDGNGSLVYSTYQERLLMGSPGRNIVTLPIKPIVAVTAATIATLMGLDAASGTSSYFTGCLPSTITNQGSGQLSGILACSGRYAYTRRDQAMSYPDLNAIINPQNLMTLFGGPAPWIPVDVSSIDYDFKTGEAWIPAGLQLQRYSEIIITYTTGYDPRYLPKLLKNATASLVKNMMLRGSGTTNILSQSVGRAAFNVTVTPDIVDPNLVRMLQPFCVTRAY